MQDILTWYTVKLCMAKQEIRAKRTTSRSTNLSHKIFEISEDVILSNYRSSSTPQCLYCVCNNAKKASFYSFTWYAVWISHAEDNAFAIVVVGFGLHILIIAAAGKEGGDIACFND